MRKENIENVGNVLKTYLAQNGLDTQMKEKEAITLFAQLAENKFAPYVKRVTCYKGKLCVELNSSAAKNELMLTREKTIKEINERLGAAIITTLIVQ